MILLHPIKIGWIYRLISDRGLGVTLASLQLYKQILIDVTDAQTYYNPKRRDTLTAETGMTNVSLLRNVIDALRDGDVCVAQRSMMAHISM